MHRSFPTPDSSWFAWLHSRWVPLVLRTLLAMGALCFLALLGRSTLAGGAPRATPPASTLSTSGFPAPQASPAMDPPGSSSLQDRQVSPCTEREGGYARSSSMVFLNEATQEDLMRLPHIGPKRAQMVLELRTRMGGRFRHVHDLLRIKGIGRATLKKIQPFVQLDRPPPAQSSR